MAICYIYLNFMILAAIFSIYRKSTGNTATLRPTHETHTAANSNAVPLQHNTNQYSDAHRYAFTVQHHGAAQRYTEPRAAGTPWNTQEHGAASTLHTVDGTAEAKHRGANRNTATRGASAASGKNQEHVDDSVRANTRRSELESSLIHEARNNLTRARVLYNLAMTNIGRAGKNEPSKPRIGKYLAMTKLSHAGT